MKRLRGQIKNLLGKLPLLGGVVILLLLYTNNNKKLALALGALFIIWRTASALYTLHTQGHIDNLAIAIKHWRNKK